MAPWQGGILELCQEVLTMDADREEWQALRKQSRQKRPRSVEPTGSTKKRAPRDTTAAASVRIDENTNEEGVLPCVEQIAQTRVTPLAVQAPEVACLQ